MSEAANKFSVIREAVASFPDRAHFRQAVAALLAGGFDQSDISVLASHEPLTAAEEKSSALVAAGLTDEVNYIGPLTIAGIILLSGGPIAATLGAVVAAGLGGAALKQAFDRGPRRRTAGVSRPPWRAERRSFGCAGPARDLDCT